MHSPNTGTISVGKYADFVVLSHDILAGSPQGLLDATVLLTVMGGRDTYRAERSPPAGSAGR